ncbi:hypothetical protein OIU77_022754 [Salix suchowensis]|uniref:Uncharacterized protein n=1 Tax=Salix suchowensis TaxID=1278906 RepID=A0ABQ9C1B6_9ROSI|nr:hypothetical protein OIU77_022754 [Salix suchowensis]
MKTTQGLLDDTVPHYTQLQQHSTEEENMLTVPRHMLVRPGEPKHGINIAVTPEDHKEKKRKIDAKYRLGCKTRKEELRIRLQNLREEKAQLKREKESCSKEDNSMAQKLQSNRT